MPRREEILSNMRTALQAQDPEWDISPGTPEYKILEAVANQLEGVSRDGLLSTYHFDIDKKAGIELDLFLSLWGFYRIKAQRATGSVTFRRATISTTDVGIPMGTQVSVPSANGAPTIYYSTISGALLSAGSTEVTVPIEAATAGLIGNIGAYRIKNFATSLPGITEVFNASPITGGINAESDEAFRERFRRTFMRNIAGTENQFAGVAFTESAFVNRVNAISAVERYSEQIQLTLPYNLTTLTPYEITGNFSGTSLSLTQTQADCLPEGVFYALSTKTSTPYKVHVIQKTGATTFSVYPDLTTGVTKLQVVFPTSAQDSQYVYPEGGEVVGVGIGSASEIIAKSGALQDYQMLTFDNDWSKVIEAGCKLPVFYFTPAGVTRLGGPGTIIDISYEYTPKSSRNNPPVSFNKLDVYVDGVDLQSISEQINMPQTNSNIFDVGPIAVDFIREDGVTHPLSGHLFTPLGRSPINALGDELTVQRFINLDEPNDLKYNLLNATTYYLNEDYWLVKKTKDSDSLENLRGSQKAVEGIEWKTPIRLSDGTDETYIFPRKGALETSGDLAAPFIATANGSGNLSGYYSYVVTWEVDGRESLPSNPVTVNADNNGIDLMFNDFHSRYPGVYIDAAYTGDPTSKTVYRRFYRSKSSSSSNAAELGPFYLVNVFRNNYEWGLWTDNKSDDDLAMVQPPKTPPPHAAPLDLNYSYNSLIERLDSKMESVRLVGQDVLSHQAEFIPLRFNLAVVLYPNVSPIAARSSIQNAISSFLNRKQFSGDLQLADLFSVLESVAEVDNVRLLDFTESFNEVQKLNISSNGSGFTSGDKLILTIGGYTTSSLSANEQSYIIREAIEAFSTFNEGDTYAAPLVNTLTTGPNETDLYVKANENALKIKDLVDFYSNPVYLQITQFGSGNENKDEIVRVVSATVENDSRQSESTFTADVTFKALSNQKAVLTTAMAHAFTIGDFVKVTGVGAEFNTNGAYIIETTATSFSYYVSSSSTITTTAATGSASISLDAEMVHFVVERAQLGSSAWNYGSDVTDPDSQAWVHLLGDIAVARVTDGDTGVTYTFTFLPNAFNQTNNWGNRSIVDLDGNPIITAEVSGNVSSSGLMVATPGRGWGIEMLASNFQTILDRYSDDIYFTSSELPIFGGLDFSVRARNTF